MAEVSRGHESITFDDAAFELRHGNTIRQGKKLVLEYVAQSPYNQDGAKKELGFSPEEAVANLNQVKTQLEEALQGNSNDGAPNLTDGKRQEVAKLISELAELINYWQNDFQKRKEE